jgi:hypothetical protein
MMAGRWLLSGQVSVILAAPPPDPGQVSVMMAGRWLLSGQVSVILPAAAA